MCFASGSKSHGIYSVFWTAPSKNSGILAEFSALQEVIVPCKNHKTHVTYIESLGSDFFFEQVCDGVGLEGGWASGSWRRCGEKCRRCPDGFFEVR